MIRLARRDLKRENITVEKTNRIDQDVGPLRRLHCCGERRRTAGIVSVGKNEQRLASGLAGDPAGGENDRVVERRTLCARLLGVQLRKSEIRKQLDLPVEADKERAVLILAQNFIEELTAGAALLVKHGALAAAHIHQKAEGQRGIGLRRKVADGLRDGRLLPA